MSRGLRALAGLLLVLAAPVAARPESTLPAYTAAYEPITVDERGLWQLVDEEERQLRESPLVIRDEKLLAYVRDVLCTTVGPERCTTVRIYIVEDPAFNASMAPNGMMTVQTGLLLRVRNAAELGAILGHEFAHFELRHSLKGFKQKRNTTDAIAWLQVAGGLAQVNTTNSQALLMGASYTFDRNQETAADLIGLEYLGKSPYPSSAASHVWANLMAEADASAFGRKQKARDHYTTGFFDTHPSELKRAAYLAAAATRIGDTADDPQAIRHAQAIAPHLGRFLNAQIKRNDFGGSAYIMDELARTQGWTPQLLYAKGEMYRARSNPRDLVTATTLFNEAIQKGYTGPEIHRSLGLALMRAGAATEARSELAEYLRAAPDASDRAIVEALVAE